MLLCGYLVITRDFLAFTHDFHPPLLALGSANDLFTKWSDK